MTQTRQQMLPDATTNAVCVQRRRLTAAQCRSRLALRAIHAGAGVAAAILVPMPIAKFAFGMAALMQLIFVLQAFEVLRRVQQGAIVEEVTASQNGKAERFAASVALVVVTSFALLCTFVSCLVLSTLGVTPGPAIFFLLMNVAAWGFTAFVWKKARPQGNTVVTASVTADASVGVVSPAAQVTVVASPVTSPAHWWTDTQLREETKVSQVTQATGGQR